MNSAGTTSGDFRAASLIPSMPKQPDLPPSVAWQLTWAAFANAAELVSASELLLKEGHYPAALSLSVSAREELGKALGALLISTEQIAPDASGAFRDHKRKQALGLVVIEALESVDFSGVQIGSLDLRTGDVYELLERVCAAVVTLADQIKFDDARFAQAEEQLEAAAAGEHEALRRRGLYVDAECLDNIWTVNTPRNLDAALAETHVHKSRRLVQLLGAVEAFFDVPGADRQVEGADDETVRAYLVASMSRLLRAAEPQPPAASE